MNKISLARATSLVFMTIFSSFFMASFVYSVRLLVYAFRHFATHWGPTPEDNITFMNSWYWCAPVVLAIVLTAFSPVSDKIASLFLPIRKKGMREDEKITPALERVKSLYREKFFKDLDIDVHVMDMPMINGIALGQRTAALSTGLLKTANDDQITAILAHEAGHLHYRDGFYNLALLAAAIPTIFLNGVLGFFFGGNKENSSSSSSGGGFISTAMVIPTIIFVCAMAPFFGYCLLSIPVLWLTRSVEFFTEWPIEYRADKFAVELGLGPALIELFEHTEDEDVRNNTGFLSKYLYTHPPTALRIDRIERDLIAEGQQPISQSAQELRKAA
jgi:Zn-dependent protease with chaperone function